MFIAKDLRAIARLFAVVLLSAAWLPQTAIASDFTTICEQGRQVAPEPLSGGQLIPGRYFNLRRSGQGWDFFWYGNLAEGSSAQADKLFVVNYTYESRGSEWVPVWYGATANPTSPNNGFGVGSDGLPKWDGILYRYRRVDFADGGFGPIRQVDPGNGANAPTAEKVGEVTVYFGANGYTVGQRPDQAAVSWVLTPSVTLRPGAPSIGTEDCLGNFVAADLVDDGNSGLWADEHSAAGWFWIPVFWKPKGSAVVNEHHVVSYFDQDGSPRWIVGADNDRVCFANGSTALYPPLEISPSKAVCAMRSKGYTPWTLLCDASNQPSGCSTWNSNNYLIRVGKLVRGGWSATSEGIKRSSLTIVREAGQVPAQQPPGGNTDTSPLSVAVVGTNLLLLRAPFADPAFPYSSVVSQLNGLTRLRVEFAIGDSDDAQLCQTIDGLCRLRVHFMTEGAHPALTIVRRRLAAPFGGSDVAVLSSGQLRSPTDGLPMPVASSATGAEALIAGDTFKLMAYATADNTQLPLFETRVLGVGRNTSGYCAFGSPPVPTTVPTPTMIVGATSADGQQFTVTTAQGVSIDTPLRGIRLRIYEASPLKLVVEKLVTLNTPAAINQSVAVAGLVPGRQYKAAAEVFNVCASARAVTAQNFTAQDYETPDDPQFNAGWTPTENSDGSASVPLAGSIPLQVEASGGSAALNIPIEVAPGRHGMQPQLALAYSSRGGNGLAGMGWGLSGTSSIHRCPRTIDQDANQPGGVEFSNNDRLCLDGQRLVAVSGSYGTGDAEYRTEVDQFLRVRQLGGSLTGTTTRFTVEYSNGQFAVYGDPTASPNSRVNVDVTGLATPQTLSWQLARRQDGAGNAVTYLYNTGGTVGSGESLLTRIQYTDFVSSSVTSGNRFVDLCYEERPGVVAPAATNPCGAKTTSIWTNAGSDRSSSYLAGALVEQTRRLRTITVSANSARVRRYELNYAAPSGYSARSLLRDVLVCGSNDTSCLPKTVFGWNERSGPRLDFRRMTEIDSIVPPPADAVPEDGVPFGPNDPRPIRYVGQLGDLDGDGTPETLVTDTLAPFNVYHPRADYVVRLNADRNGGQVFRAPDGWFTDDLTQVPVSGLSSAMNFREWDDLNNDGRVDAWYLERTEVGCREFLHSDSPSHLIKECNVQFRLRVGTFSGDAGTWSAQSFAFESNVFAGDTTGSGLVESTQSAYYKSIGPPSSSLWERGNDPASLRTRTSFVDVNGDGLKDLLLSRRVPYADPAAQSCRRSDDPAEPVMGVPVLQVFANLSVRGGTQFRFGAAPIYQSCLPSKPHPAYVGPFPTMLFDVPRYLSNRDYASASLHGDMDGDGLLEMRSVSLDAHKPQFHFGRRNGFGVTPAQSGILGWGNLLTSESDPLVAWSDQLGPGMAQEGWWGTSGPRDEAAHAVMRFDVNGDGLEDLVYDHDPPVISHYTKLTRVRLNTGRKGNSNTLYTAPIELRAVDGSIGVIVAPPFGAQFAIPHDFDSDGRPEIISPGHFAARLCTMLKVRGNEQRYEFIDEAGAVAESSGAAPEPNGGAGPPLENFYFCPGTSLHGYPALKAGTEVSGVRTKEMYANGFGSFDSSLYYANAFKFAETRVAGTGALEYRLVALGQTKLITNASGDVKDLFGDGLDDAPVHFDCKNRMRDDPIDGKRCQIPTSNNVTCPSSQPALCNGWIVASSYGPLNLPNVSIAEPNGTSLVVPSEFNPNVSTFNKLAFGHYLTENLGVLGVGLLPAGSAPPLPELLASAIQLSSTATPLKQWQFSYQPLSSSAGRGPDEVPLYEIPSSGLRGTAREKHYYFTSSMPVLSTYTETVNGGSGQRVYQRTHSFGYREALYNNAGRGFRGFRDIIEEVDALTTSGQLLPGTRTLTRFEHYFPMSGLVSCSAATSSAANLSMLECPPDAHITPIDPPISTLAITVLPVPGIVFPGRLSREQRGYLTSATGGRFSVQPTSMLAETFDPTNGSVVSQTITTLANYDSYGHPGITTTITRDIAELGSGDIVRTSVASSTYDPLTAAIWWPDRLVRSVQTSSVVDARLPIGASPPSQSTTTLTGYDLITRQPNCQMVLNGALATLNPALASTCADPGVAGWSSSAKASFDVFGNPSLVTQYIQGEAARTATTQWCTGAACTNASDSTGYFPLSVFNAAGHATCSTFDPGHGAALTVRQPMTTNSSCAGTNGLTTSVLLDALGRPIKQEFPKAGAALMSSATPQHTARQWCGAGPPTRCAGTSSVAVLREVVEQQGAPVRYRFFDAEGNVVAERAQGFAGNEYRSVYRTFDDFGRLKSESQPTLASTPGYSTEHAYDVYGRMIAKWTPRLRLDGGGVTSVLLTTYYPQGLRTDIGVQTCTSVTPPAQLGAAPTCNGAYGQLLAMSRLFNSAGKVLETTDANGGDTRFVYDGGGNVVRLVDAAGMATTAVYDGLGRRLSSLDPNQGARSYLYNGAGELKSETDARGWVTTFSYDVLGRVTQRNWNEQALAPNTANLRDIGVDTFVYDTLGAGILREQSRTLTRQGSGVVLESSRHLFDVDALYRSNRVEQWIKTGSGTESFVSTTRHDKNFGRAKQAVMPDGVSVVYRYNALGFAQGEALLEQAADPNQYLRKVMAQPYAPTIDETVTL